LLPEVLDAFRGDWVADQHVHIKGTRSVGDRKIEVKRAVGGEALRSRFSRQLEPDYQQANNGETPKQPYRQHKL
jgi:hypothetical protein